MGPVPARALRRIVSLRILCRPASRPSAGDAGASPFRSNAAAGPLGWRPPDWRGLSDLLPDWRAGSQS